MTDDEVEDRFSYHPPQRQQVSISFDHVRSEFRELALTLNRILPETREKAIVFTNLEQAMFWSNAAIARNQDNNKES